ncbi:hypothetical protein SK128_025180 [Halocaridina rubra]|uniref:MAM domain-containing protein n=1 Tax=Halocaridina rubra TaxID=373956 RepID=A0AAN8ZUK1_HALRR
MDFTCFKEPLGENDCDFENYLQPLCTWINVGTNDSIYWVWNMGPPDTVSPGPSSDHTYGATGHYLYVEALWEYPPDSIPLSQGPVQATQCFRFWYYMFGEKPPVLSANVRLVSSENSSPIFIRSGSQGDVWHPAVVDLEVETEQYYVEIRAQWNESSQGIVAVDDLRLHTSLCERYPNDPEAIHDFELDGSEFSGVSGLDIDWDLIETGNKPDHTLGTMKGVAMICLIIKILFFKIYCLHIVICRVLSHS